MFQNKINTFSEKIDINQNNSSNQINHEIKGNLLAEVKNLKNFANGDLKLFPKSKFSNSPENKKDDLSPQIGIDQNFSPINKIQKDNENIEMYKTGSNDSSILQNDKEYIKHKQRYDNQEFKSISKSTSSKKRKHEY